MLLIIVYRKKGLKAIGFFEIQYLENRKKRELKKIVEQVGKGITLLNASSKQVCFLLLYLVNDLKSSINLNTLFMMKNETNL